MMRAREDGSSETSDREKKVAACVDPARAGSSPFRTRHLRAEIEKRAGK
jgi:hypothetical protein